MAYHRGRGRRSVASRDNGSLGGTCDSEAETDQSAASRSKDISEHFDRLAVSKCEEKLEPHMATKHQTRKVTVAMQN